MRNFRLTIWKPFRPDRPVHYAWDIGTDDVSTFDAHKLQEMIYSWAPEEDVLGGITNETIRVELRARLFEDFSEGLPPHDRSFAKLWDLIRYLEQIQAIPAVLQWTSTSQTADPAPWSRDIRNSAEDTSTPLRCAPTIVLHQHLLWLAEVYGNMPGLFIIIR